MKKIFILSFVVLSISLMACKSYGDKVKKENIEVYYKSGITREQAQATADLLFQSQNTTSNGPKKSFQLTKENDTFFFRMVADQSKLPTISADVWYSMGYYISNKIFDGKPVNVQLTDKYFKTIRSYTYQNVSSTDTTTSPQ